MRARTKNSGCDADARARNNAFILRLKNMYAWPNVFFIYERRKVKVDGP